MPDTSSTGSSLVHETLGTNLYALMPGFAALTAGSTLAGTGRGRTPSRFRFENERQDNITNYIPGVAAYRIGRRLADVARDSGSNAAKARRKARAEVLGTYTALLAPTAVATALRLGGAIAPRYGEVRLPFGKNLPGVDLKGNFVGDLRRGGKVALGLTAAGLALAAIRGRRTKQEQGEVDNEPVALDYLVPGWAGYNHYKRLGRTLDWKEDPSASVLQHPLSPIGEAPALVNPLSQTQTSGKQES